MDSTYLVEIVPLEHISQKAFVCDVLTSSLSTLECKNYTLPQREYILVVLNIMMPAGFEAAQTNQTNA